MNRKRSMSWLALLLVALLPALYGCPDARAAPGEPTLETMVQEADSVSYLATWPPGRNADGSMAPSHDWTADADNGSWGVSGTVPAADSAADGTLSDVFTVPRDSTDRPATFCVAARNANGTSPEECVGFTVPALALPPSAPGTPSVDTTTATAMWLGSDSTTVFAQGIGPGAVTHNTDEYGPDDQASYVGLIWTADGGGVLDPTRPFVCGRVDGGALSLVPVEVSADSVYHDPGRAAYPIGSSGCGFDFVFTVSDTSMVDFVLGTPDGEPLTLPNLPASAAGPTVQRLASRVTTQPPEIHVKPRGGFTDDEVRQLSAQLLAEMRGGS